MAKEKWAGSAGCLSRLHCWSCLGTHPAALQWRWITSYSFDLIPEGGPCPFGRTWPEVEAERAARIAAVPGRVAETLNAQWDAVFTKLRAILTDTQFAQLLAALKASGAFGADDAESTLVAETIARRRGLDLSQRVGA